MSPVTLRPYQSEAFGRILAELKLVRATLLILATGLGKTVTFAAVAQYVVSRARRVLVLAHRAELLEQAAATLQRFGLTVGIEQGERRAGDDVQVVVASVQSLQGKRLERFAPDAFGLVIIDECHHAPARSYRTVLAHFEPAKVLGVTATPDRSDEIALGNVFESVAFKMEIAEGIKGGWLAPLELRSVVVEHCDLSGVRSRCGDFVAAELERELLDERVLHEVAKPLSELAKGRPTLVFVVGVAQAHALALTLQGYGVKAAAVDGSMSAEARAAVIADYRAGRVQVVCNAMLLTEGFDAPETSCIALVRPTRSRSLLTQMIGRGTRLAGGKGECLIIDFVPSRAGSIRLASPADALAGKELPSALLQHVREFSADESGDLGELIERAKAAEAERERQVVLARERERQRLVQNVGVVYMAPRLDVERLLDVMRDPADRSWDDGELATESQVEALERAGFDHLPEELTSREARALFDVLRKRRAAGLCTLRQGRILRKYGLRDDVSFTLAQQALDALKNNRWRPPLALLRDARFAREQAVA